MCDCYTALKSATKGSLVLFGKNSDRFTDEAQPIEHFLRQRHDTEKVKCTHIEIPQVEETYEVILSSPWWIWGAEIGVNEKGVAIGNETEWSKDMRKKGTEELIGMDLVRLGLERGKNAHEAMHVMVDLLEKFGQGGNCEYNGEFYYDNAFLIADPKEAWVLETAGKHWITKRYEQGVVPLSNIYTIERNWDENSQNLVSHAIEKGWCETQEDFNFARNYTDFQEAFSMMSQIRQDRSSYLLNRKEKSIDVEYMMEISRDHNEGSFLAPRWGNSESAIPSICFHADKRMPYQTCGAIVAELDKDLPVCWITGTSNPCISIFKPYYLGFNISIPEQFCRGTNKFSEESAWWIHERMKRLANKLNPQILFPIIRSFWMYEEKMMLETSNRLAKKASELVNEGKREEAKRMLEPFVRESWDRCLEKTKKLYNILRSLKEIVPRNPHIHSSFWEKQNSNQNLIP